MPIWLPGIPRLQGARHHSRQVPQHAPEGVVIHSGSSSPNVAEYVANGPADGRRVSYHLAWSSGLQRFAQLVDLERRAWHASSEGNDWLGLALSGPWDQDPRRDIERAEFVALMPALMVAVSSLRYWCRHSDITPGKRDPGPGFSEDWIRCSGLVHRPSGPA